jgi:predicted PurR-regulated permease PerM
MSVRQQAAGWGGAIVVFGVALYALSGVLLPFLAAIAIGYVLDPVADRLERAGMSRLWATLVILLALSLVTLLVVALVAPVLLKQLAAFIEAFPSLLAKAQAGLAQEGGAWLEKLGLRLAERLGVDPAAVQADVQKWLGEFVGQAAQWLLGVAKSVLSGGAALLNVVSLVVITPVVAFYVLLDWDKMVAAIDRNIPPRDRASVRRIGQEIDVALAGFLRGQSLVALFLGVWYAAGLSLIGLNYGFLIGVIGGVTSFIPYVGSLLTLMLAVTVAIAQGWPSLALAGMTVLVVASGQFLEGNILSPRLVGDSVGLHPVWLMFALLAFGALFGFSGLLVAVPVSAALGVLVRHGLASYRQSAFFNAAAPSDESLG